MQVFLEIQNWRLLVRVKTQNCRTWWMNQGVPQKWYCILGKTSNNSGPHAYIFNFKLARRTIEFSFFFVKIYKSILVFRNVMSDGPLWTSSPYFSYFKYKSCLLTVQNQRKFQCTKDFGYIGKFSFVFILCQFWQC